MNSNGIDLSSVLQGSSAQTESATPTETTVDVPSLIVDATDAIFEQLIGLSHTVPVVVDLWAEWCEPCKVLGPILESVTRSMGGLVMLAKVDVDNNPGIASTFQAQSIPTVVALVAGKAVPLFQGALPEAQVRDFYGQLIELARQHGVTGKVSAPDQSDENAAPAEPEINPAHETALDALESGDYPTAIAEYKRVIVNNPKDDLAMAQLARANLLHRLTGVDPQTARDEAAAAPTGVAEQLLVADLDLSGGHIEDSFLRILDLFASASEDDKLMIRERLLELFEVVGHSDQRVSAARIRLSNLLF